MDTQTGQTQFYETLHALDLRTGADNITPQVITATSSRERRRVAGWLSYVRPLSGKSAPGSAAGKWTDYCHLRLSM